MRAGSNMGPGGQGWCGPAQIWGPEVKVREVLSGRGLREKTQTPFIPYRIPTGVPMRVGFGICKDCGDAGRLEYGARRSRVMRSGSNMGPGGQGEGGAQWAWT